MSAHPDTSAQDKRPTTPEALMSALVSGPVLAIPHADWHFCRRLSWRLCQRSCWRLFLVPVSALGVGRLCVRLFPPLQPCRRMRGHPPADPVSKAKAKVGPKRQGPGLKTKAQGRRTKVQDSCGIFCLFCFVGFSVCFALWDFLIVSHYLSIYMYI